MVEKFKQSKHSSKILGTVFCSFFGLFAYILAQYEFFAQYHLNSLMLAIAIGMVLGNTFAHLLPHAFKDGILFSSKQILRFAIVLYGFRITFGQIFEIGFNGLFAVFLMFITTYFLGYFIGTRFFKLDKDLCILTSVGSSICGAAAVLGANSVLKTQAHKVSLAVATVVIFGTISMFLYPFIYKLGILDQNQFGLFIGASVHEVAQVVAVGGVISPEVMDAAVVAKLTRVMILVPFLFILIYFVAKTISEKEKTKIQTPYFVIFFVFVAGFNSFDLLAKPIVDFIVELDTVLLSVAMFALGLETNFRKIKDLGFKPMVLAFIMFIWLVLGGIITIKFLA